MAAGLDSGQSLDLSFEDVIIGTWKRNLEWREFGGNYEHVRTSNTVVVVEEFTKSDAQVTPGTRFLKWTFGKSPRAADLKFGYVMKVQKSPDSSETLLEWQYMGHTCHGRFVKGSRAAVLNFFLSSATVVVTYRIVDDSTLSICIVEIDEHYTPTVQYGNMSRVDLSGYEQYQQRREE